MNNKENVRIRLNYNLHYDVGRKSSWKTYQLVDFHPQIKVAYATLIN